jgi:hypothetical protein
MRCFVPASDDEIYDWIARHGFAGLVAYQPGMRLQASLRMPVPPQPPNPLPAAAPAPADQRRAA